MQCLSVEMSAPFLLRYLPIHCTNMKNVDTTQGEEDAPCGVAVPMGTGAHCPASASMPVPPVPLSHPSRPRSILIFLRKPFMMTVIKVSFSRS